MLSAGCCKFIMQVCFKVSSQTSKNYRKPYDRVLINVDKNELENELDFDQTDFLILYYSIIVLL